MPDITGAVHGYLGNIPFLWNYIKLGLWLGILGVFSFTFLRFRFIVLIRSQRGEGQKIGIDLGRKSEKDGVKELRLLFRRKTVLPFPSTVHINPAVMGFEFVEFYSDGSSNLHPVSFGFIERDRTPFLYPEKQDHKAWHLLQSRKNEQTYGQDFMSKYGQILSLGLVIVCCLVTIILTFKQLDKAMAFGSNVVNQAGQVMSSIKAPPIS